MIFLECAPCSIGSRKTALAGENVHTGRLHQVPWRKSLNFRFGSFLWMHLDAYGIAVHGSLFLQDDMSIGHAAAFFWQPRLDLGARFYII